MAMVAGVVQLYVVHAALSMRMHAATKWRCTMNLAIHQNVPKMTRYSTRSCSKIDRTLHCAI